MQEYSHKKKSTRIRSKTRKKTPNLLLLFLILFSSSVFYNEEHLKLYIGIASFICLYAYFRAIIRPTIIAHSISNSFTGWLLILFSIYFYYGLVLTKYSFFNSDYFLFTLIIILVIQLLFIDVNHNTMIEVFTKSSAIGSLAVCGFILINEWDLIISGGTRIGDSGSGNVNTVAMYLGLMSIPSIYKFLFENKRFYLVVYIVSIAFMLMTGSKKALIYIILGLVILSVQKNGIRLQRYIFPILLAVGVIILILNNQFLYNIIGARTMDFLASIGFKIEGAHYSNSTSLRLSMYKLAFQAFMENPIFGGGWFYFSAYSGLGTYSHNNYTELLVNYGIVGFLIYYIMFFYVLLKLKKISKLDNNAKLLSTMIIVILVCDAAAVTFSLYLINYIVLVFGFLYVRNYRIANKSIDTP